MSHIVASSRENAGVPEGASAAALKPAGLQPRLLASRSNLTVSPRIVLIMGVAGSGKTTTGRRLAAELGWPYHEADDFHPPANKEKMARGLPLDDQDRAPWLSAIRNEIDRCLAAGQSAVFTCSALRERYRRALAADTPAVVLVYLSVDPATALARVNQRQGHYLKAGLVESQFEALEVPAKALTVDAALPPVAVVAAIRQCLDGRPG